jgi:hypothetical protein
MVKISRTDCVRNGVLHRVKKERIILRAIKRVNAIELVTPYIGAAFIEGEREGKREGTGGSG